MRTIFAQIKFQRKQKRDRIRVAVRSHRNHKKILDILPTPPGDRQTGRNIKSGFDVPSFGAEPCQIQISHSIGLLREWVGGKEEWKGMEERENEFLNTNLSF